MKPIYLKRSGTCKECGGTIEKGTPCIQIKFKFGEHWNPCNYHLNCLIVKLERWFVENQPSEARAGGRRRKSIFNIKRRKLISLKIYHQKKGNTERVEQLEKQIKELEGANVEKSAAMKVIEFCFHCNKTLPIFTDGAGVEHCARCRNVIGTKPANDSANDVAEGSDELKIEKYEGEN